VNVREQEASLTQPERLVYAAAFAGRAILQQADVGDASVRAWRAVLFLRDDATSHFRLSQSVDWECVREMFESFKAGAS
jgi:hypothetical protein